MRIRVQPRTLMLAFFGFGLFLSCVTSTWGTLSSLFSLNENQILYLFSTSAQVLAGIYGLTLTGFIFFRNELSREEQEDETLADAVESLKARYFKLLAFITILVLATIALSNLAISMASSSRSAMGSIVINSGQSLFATSLVTIAYFIFDVISPRRIEAASKALQSTVDPTYARQNKGSLEDFLRNYNEIESLLTEYGLSANLEITASSSKQARRPSNARLAEILARNELISKDLYTRIRNLITLRNSIIHGADPVVSQELLESSHQVLTELKKALNNET
jgi:uncharacterized protein YutE (UPF0331/DUF86 family)